MSSFYETASAELRALLPEIVFEERLANDGVDPAPHGVLVVWVVFNPLGGAPITVRFDDDEYTVVWNAWHTHETNAGAVATLVRDIIGARCGVYTAQRADGGWLGSRLAPIDDDAWLDWITAPRFPSQVSFTLRSWTTPLLKAFP